MGQARINTEKQLMVFSHSIWRDCQYTSIIKGSYTVFYQGIQIDHCAHVPCLVDQYISESEYNAVYTAVLVLEKIRMLNNEFLQKNTDMVP